MEIKQDDNQTGDDLKNNLPQAETVPGRSVYPELGDVKRSRYIKFKHDCDKCIYIGFIKSKYDYIPHGLRLDGGYPKNKRFEIYFCIRDEKIILRYGNGYQYESVKFIELLERKNTKRKGYHDTYIKIVDLIEKSKIIEVKNYVKLSLNFT